MSVWLLFVDEYKEHREIKLQKACEELGATIVSFETKPECKFYIRGDAEAVDQLALDFEWITKIFEIIE